MENNQILDISLLYVEDEELTRSSLQRFLSKRVRTLHVAENGAAGLELFNLHNPDIIITDISMPVMDGLSMVRCIRETNKNIPVIVTTAFNDEIYFLESIDVGIDKYVKKPVNTEILSKSLFSIAKALTLQNALEVAQHKVKEQYLIMREEMKMAALFQQKMMPKKELQLPNPDFDLAWHSHSCTAVSGDFLILENLDQDHFGMLLIDVMGHGVAAGLVTIELKTIFEDIKRSSYSPSEILKTVNDKILCISDGSMFFTALYAIYSREHSSITVSSAGAIPFIVYHARENRAEVCYQEGSLIGVFPNEEFKVLEKTIPLQEGDVYLMQTDGLIETFNKDDERFDDFFSQQKFIRQIERKLSAQETIDNIVREVTEHKGRDTEFHDDATIIVFRKK